MTKKKGTPSSKVAGAIAPAASEADAPAAQATTEEYVDADGVVHNEAPAPAVEPSGQLNALADENERDAEMLMRFSSAEEVLSTAQALTARASDLRALAKKAREIGRLREATSIEREAAHIGEALLPQVQAQIGIPFDDMEDLLDALVRSVGRTVRAAAVRAVGLQLTPIEGESQADTDARRKELVSTFETVVGAIAEHAAAAVVPYLEETAERSYAAGYEARNATPRILARVAVQAAAAKQD